MPQIDRADLQLIEAAAQQICRDREASLIKLEEEFFTLSNRTVRAMRKIVDASRALGGSDDSRGLFTRSRDLSQRIIEQLRTLREQNVSSADIPSEQIITFRLLLWSAGRSAQTDAATAVRYRALESRLREMR